jgi:restriction system protein
MGRRAKRKNDNTLGLAVVVLIVLALIGSAFKDQPGLAASIVALGIGLIIGVPFYLGRQASEAVGAKLRDLMAQHRSALARKRSQLLTSDAYGKAESGKWQKEVDYFLRTQLVPLLTQREKKRATKIWAELQSTVDSFAATEFATNRDAFSLPIEKMSPTEFEGHCAQRLRNVGWSAQTTKASGDQGIDVIAEFGRAKVVLQCKLYAQPVGNKAVQEAVAGRTFYGAQFSGVVSNATFTPSAKQLAASTGVILLHYSELDGLATMLGL